MADNEMPEGERVYAAREARRAGFDILQSIAELGGTLTPKASPLGQNGYIYPIPQLDLRVVRGLVDDGCLSSQFFERVHLCPACASHHLSLREICPACQSANLGEDLMLHHFRCGYVGRVHEFTTGGDIMVCPKCRRRMAHLGTEYDRLDKMLRCNACQVTFQEAPVEALCLACGARTAADQLGKADVFSYRLTSQGLSLLQQGCPEPVVDELIFMEGLPIYRRHVALALLQQEQRRAELMSRECFVLLLRCLTETAEAAALESVRQQLTGLEVLGEVSPRQYVVILPGADRGAAERAHARLRRAEVAMSIVNVTNLRDLDQLKAGLEQVL